jgi:hypothetical protein
MLRIIANGRQQGSRDSARIDDKGWGGFGDGDGLRFGVNGLAQRSRRPGVYFGTNLVTSRKLGLLQIKSNLQVHPAFCVTTKVTCQSQCCIGRNGSPLQDDIVNAGCCCNSGQ